MTLKGHLSALNKTDNKARAQEEKIAALVKGGVSEGSRNQTMYIVGCKYKTAGVPKDKAIEYAGKLNNDKFFPPMHYAEMKRTIESAYTREIKEAEEIKERSKEKLKEELSHYRYISDIERYIDLRNPESLVTFNTLKVRYANYVNTSEVMSIAFAEGFIEEIGGVGYHPGEGAVFTYRGIERANRFRPSKIQPRDEADKITVILEHLNSLVPIKAERELLLQWLAFIVQRPGIKIKWAPMIKTSEQGTGKSLIGVLLKNILGENNVSAITCKAYKNPFNSRWAGKCQLLIVNEAKFDAEDYDNLKEHITETDIEVNGKGIPQYETYNCTNFLFFSNAVNPIVLPTQDRRIFLITSNFSNENQDYYDTLFNCIDSSSAEFLHYLKYNIDISNFNPHKRPIKTAAHAEQVNRSKDEQLKAIEELFHSQEMPELVHQEWIKERLKMQYKQIKSNYINEAMDNIGAVSIGRIAFKEDDAEVKRVVYITVNHAKWLLLKENGATSTIKAYLSSIACGRSGKLETAAQDDVVPF